MLAGRGDPREWQPARDQASQFLRPYDKQIGFHPESGRGTIRHNTNYDYTTGVSVPGPLTDADKASMQGITGYAGLHAKASEAHKGQLHTFQIGDLHTAIKNLPGHRVEPKALLAAAKHFAANNGAVGGYVVPKTWKGAANGGLDAIPFQQYGIMFGASRDGALLALDMGLGKTLCGLGVFSQLHAQGKVTKSMIFAPDAVVPGWLAIIAYSKRWPCGC